MRGDFLFFIFVSSLFDTELCLSATFYPSKYLENNLLIRIFGLSFTSCRRECLARLQCESVNFCPIKSICELNMEPIKSRPYMPITKRGWVFVPKKNEDEVIHPACHCTEGQKCYMDDRQRCEVTECLPPDNTSNLYVIHGNILTVGGKIITTCRKEFWLNEEARPRFTSTCGPTGNWESSETLPDCGKIIFRIFSGVNHGILGFWENARDTNNVSCIDYPTPSTCTEPYRHDDTISQWETLMISRVLLAVAKNDVEVHYVLFDGTGSDFENWFSKERILKSSWVDLHASTVDMVTMKGVASSSPKCQTQNRFLISKTSGDCDSDSGWFTAITPWTKKAPCCEHTVTDRLQLWYSKGNTSAVWSQPSGTDNADYIDVIILAVNDV